MTGNGTKAQAQHPERWVVVQIPLLAATLAAPVAEHLIGITALSFGAFTWLARGIGPAAIAAGALAVAAAKHELGDDLVASPRPVPGSALRQSGIYGHLRHPIYGALIAATFGWALLWTSWIGIALSALCCLFFLAKMRYEEHLLVQELPGYSAYMQRVPAIVPKFWRMRG